MASGYNTYGTVYIDGVKVKLNENFKPPPKVSLSDDVEAGNPTEILFMEYDFSLENSVIAWSNERKRHIEWQKTQLQLLDEQKKQKLLEQQKLETEKQLFLLKRQQQKQIEKNEARKEANKTSDKQSADSTGHHSKERGASDMMNTSDLNSTSTSNQNQSATSDQQAADSEEPSFTETTGLSVAHQPQEQTFTAGQQQQAFIANQPVFYSVGQGILTPLPANSPVVRKTLSSGSSSFNPADFENEVDPFDNLELKTLDDMKELDKVLKGVEISNDKKSDLKHQTSSAQSSSTNNSVVSSSIAPKLHGVGDLVTSYTYTAGSENHLPLHDPSSQSNGQKPPHGYLPSSTKTDVSGSASANIPTGTVPQFSGAHPVSINYNSGSVSFKSFPSSASSSVQRNTHSQSQISNVGGGSSVPYSTANSVTHATPNSHTQISSNGYNYAHLNSSNNNKLTESDTIRQTTLATEVGNTNQVPNQYQIWTEFLQKSSSNVRSNEGYQPPSNNVNSSSNHFPMNGYVGGNIHNQLVEEPGTRSQGHSRSNTPPPTATVGKLRSARSTPDLVALTNNSQSVKLNYSKSPPVPRRMQSPHRPSSVYNNQQEVEKKESSPPSIPAEKQVDLYNSMPLESKRFIDRITNMGFKRIMVSKAVQMFGTNEKKVLDFLFSVNKLKEKEVNANDAESVLLVPETHEKKAKEFTLLCKRFQEFGFDEKKVWEALIKFNLDEERTLDWLTTN